LWTCLRVRDFPIRQARLKDKLFPGSREHREGTQAHSGRGVSAWEEAGSRQGEQKCKKVRHDMEPGTGGGGGHNTEEAAGSGVTTPLWGETDLSTLQAVHQSCIP